MGWVEDSKREGSCSRYMYRKFLQGKIVKWNFILNPAIAGFFVFLSVKKDIVILKSKSGFFAVAEKSNVWRKSSRMRRFFQYMFFLFSI
ncbi:hypothetical protein D9754_03890 [Planomicrobium sp. Y74]|nr:hypothetical protein D9754_03890 [Planomicrobium sp. Y74]